MLLDYEKGRSNGGGHSIGRVQPNIKYMRSEPLPHPLSYLTLLGKPPSQRSSLRHPASNYSPPFISRATLPPLPLPPVCTTFPPSFPNTFLPPPLYPLRPTTVQAFPLLFYRTLPRKSKNDGICRSGACGPRSHCVGVDSFCITPSSSFDLANREKRTENFIVLCVLHLLLFFPLFLAFRCVSAVRNNRNCAISPYLNLSLRKIRLLQPFGENIKREVLWKMGK